MIWAIIILLLIIVLFLSIAIYLIIKKTSYLSEKEKEIIVFAIDMYINYGEELEIFSDKHELIVAELKKLKNKIYGK